MDFSESSDGFEDHRIKLSSKVRQLCTSVHLNQIKSSEQDKIMDDFNQEIADQFFEVDQPLEFRTRMETDPKLMAPLIAQNEKILKLQKELQLCRDQERQQESISNETNQLLKNQRVQLEKLQVQCDIKNKNPILVDINTPTGEAIDVQDEIVRQSHYIKDQIKLGLSQNVPYKKIIGIEVEKTELKEQKRTSS